MQKAGAKGSLKSLHRYVFEKNVRIAVRFDINPPSLQKVETQIRNSTENATIEYDIYSLPFYLVGELNRLIEQSTVK